MKRTVQETIREYRMVEPGELVLCALSGGADSVSLLLCLKELDVRVCACHLNHGLRGENADGDEVFCRRLCEREKIPFLSERTDAAQYAAQAGLSLETASRELRYAFFDRSAEAFGAEKIATAHTADDNLETMLFRLIRGTGAAGLAGIPPVRGRIIRPLLHVERAQVEEYLTARGQDWRTDESNAENFCTRNRIRHQVIPALRAIAPDAARHAAQTARLLRQDDEALERLAQPPGNRPGTAWLNAQPEAIRSRAVRAAIRTAGVPEGELTAGHVRAAEVLCERGRGRLSLPGGYTAAVQNGKLAVYRMPRKTEGIPLEPEIPVEFGEYRVLLTEDFHSACDFDDTIVLSCDIIKKTPLVLRTWRPDDRMALPGARGERTLKRLYTDRSIPPERRDGLPVLCGAGEVLAAAGVGAAAQWQATGEKTGQLWLCWTRR